jgi:hypothetical protein
MCSIASFPLCSSLLPSSNRQTNKTNHIHTSPPNRHSFTAAIMAHTATAQDSPHEVSKRPKGNDTAKLQYSYIHSHSHLPGILKNTHSYQQTSPDARVTPTHESPSHSHSAISDLPGPAITYNNDAANRPSMPNRGMSEKEIVQLNTELNAGEAGHRRTSSHTRNSMTRRQSSNSGSQDETNPRLKWDEANLYVNESQMGRRDLSHQRAGPERRRAGHEAQAEQQQEQARE